jgi:adenylate kinase family enzyme
MRIAILGNSGSGKSTLAHWLARRGDAAVLDLDMLAWIPGAEVLRRPLAESGAELRTFCERHPRWVIEGCYAGMIEVALSYRPTLIFLNPGTAICEAHCRARPWEPHKYASREAQDANLEPLLAWVRDYAQREGELSLASHRALFEAYDGPRFEWLKPVVFEPPEPRLLDVLADTRTLRPAMPHQP